tara:strand:+ start:57384 stop:57494 length:111 start_codon:yes stop_codon:yes gene_type:complete
MKKIESISFKEKVIDAVLFDCVPIEKKPSALKNEVS